MSQSRGDYLASGYVGIHDVQTNAVLEFLKDFKSVERLGKKNTANKLHCKSRCMCVQSTTARRALPREKACAKSRYNGCLAYGNWQAAEEPTQIYIRLRHTRSKSRSIFYRD